MSRGQGLVSFFQTRASSRSLLGECMRVTGCVCAYSCDWVCLSINAAAPVFKRSASSLESEVGRICVLYLPCSLNCV